MGPLNESESKLRTVMFVQELDRVVEQLESGRCVSEAVLQPMLAKMKEKADHVLELALEYSELPAQFARARKRLRAHLRNSGREENNNQAEATKFEFQGLTSLLEIEGVLREQQDQLETQ